MKLHFLTWQWKYMTFVKWWKGVLAWGPLTVILYQPAVSFILKRFYSFKLRLNCFQERTILFISSIVSSLNQVVPLSSWGQFRHTVFIFLLNGCVYSHCCPLHKPSITSNSHLLLLQVKTLCKKNLQIKILGLIFFFFFFLRIAV